MTSAVGTWIIAGLMLLAAVVIAVFWITWFRAKHDEPWLPPGYTNHERVFVFADAPLAALLVLSAVLLLLERPLGESLALIAAGMLAFLGILDTAYFAREGMFARDRGGVANAAIVISVLVLAAVLAVRFA